MINGKPYIYIISSPCKECADGRQLARMLERCLFPVFVEDKRTRKKRDIALDCCDVLVLSISSKGGLDDENISYALERIKSSERGVKLYLLSTKVKELEGFGDVKHYENTASGIVELRDELLTLEEKEEPAESTSEPQGKFSNMKNIAFIVGFIAAVCILFRIIMFIISKKGM